MPPRKIFTHVVGTDIIRDDARRSTWCSRTTAGCPSGVSYVLENRNLLNRVFPEFFASYPVRPIKDYPGLLLDTLLHSAPRSSQSPVTVVLSPGIHNSAYFEHSYPRARDGRGSRGGARPSRRGQSRLHATDPRQAPGATSSTGEWTTSSSIPSPSAATACSACRGSSTSTARATWSSPTRRERAWPTTRRVYAFMPAPHQVLPGRGRRSCPRCRPIVGVRAATTSRYIARARSTSWW